MIVLALLMLIVGPLLLGPAAYVIALVIFTVLALRAIRDSHRPY